MLDCHRTTVQPSEELATKVRAAFASQTADAVGEMRCPACAEPVSSAALVCKHCGRHLPSQFDRIVAEYGATSKTSRDRMLALLTQDERDAFSRVLEVRGVDAKKGKTKDGGSIAAAFFFGLGLLVALFANLIFGGFLVLVAIALMISRKLRTG